MSARANLKVVLTDKAPALSPPAVAKLSDLHLVQLEGTEAEERLLSEMRDAFAVVTGLRTISREAIAASPGLKLLVSPGAGYDHIDVAAATEHGVYVANAPGANAISVAEIAVALMFAIARSLPQSYSAAKAGLWVDDSLRQKIVGVELTGRTAGIVGMGNVGRELARRLKGLGMNVISYTRRPSKEREKETGVRFVSLDELLRFSDFVVICSALTPDTRGLIGRREIGLMKSTAYLVNVARGAIVDERALEDALKSKSIAGAALDVLTVEPPGKDHPFFHLDNAVVTTHLGSRTQDAIDRVSHMVADEILRVRDGSPPLNLVNPLVLAGRPGISKG